MPIAFLCQCGQGLRVKEKYAGHTLKCPACGKPVHVPPASTTATPVPPAASLAPAKSAAPVDEPVIDISHLALPDDPTAAAHSKKKKATGHDLTCPACNAKLPFGTVLCDCGYSLRLGRQVRAGYAQGSGGKVWFSLLGIDVTTLKMVFAVLLLGLLTSAGAWWWFGPGQYMNVLEVQAVHVADAIPSLGLTAKPNLFKGNLFTVKAPSSHEFQAGGRDRLVLVRPEAQGDYLMVRVSMAEKVLLRHAQFEEAGLILNSELFEVQAGDQKFKPVVLRKPLPDPMPIGISNSDESCIRPADVPPALEHVTPRDPDSGMATGVFNYDGLDNAKGNIQFQSFATERGTSFTAQGDLHLSRPGGIEVDYSYRGGEMTVKVNPGTQTWHGIKDDLPRQSAWGMDRYELALVFPRPPQDAGKSRIFFNGQHIATVSASYGLDQAPAPVNSRGQKPGKHDYLGALGQSRRLAQNTVAASNIQQLVTGITAYHQSHQNQWPEKLDDLEESMPGLKPLLVHPRSKEDPGFLYVKPQNPDPSAREPMIYEALEGQIDPNGSIGYSDGSVEVK